MNLARWAVSRKTNTWVPRQGETFRWIVTTTARADSASGREKRGEGREKERRREKEGDRITGRQTKKHTRGWRDVKCEERLVWIGRM